MFSAILDLIEDMLKERYWKVIELFSELIELERVKIIQQLVLMILEQEEYPYNPS